MKYGLLCYSANTGNIGNEIQSIAAEEFLPRIDYFIDQDRLSEFFTDSQEKVALISNAFYGHYPEYWPPSPQIIPILISMHISCDAGLGPAKIAPSKFMLSSDLVDYLRAWGPVGARDLHTLELLERASVPSYFSACLTLTLPRSSTVKKQDLLVLNDVPEEAIHHVQRIAQQQILLTSHRDYYTADRNARFAKARQLLFCYQSAMCVITTRLHCALPCLAMGTPVLLLDAAKDQARFSGLKQMLRHCSVDSFISGRCDFNINNLQPNTDDYLAFRESLRNKISHSLARITDDPQDSWHDELSMLKLRYQTLLALHAERGERLKRLEKELRQKSFLRRTWARAIDHFR